MPAKDWFLVVAIYGAWTIAPASAAGLAQPGAHSAAQPAAQAARPNPNPVDVAGIPVNYDEAKVGNYTLPDPLMLNNGKRVRDAKAWFAKRRPEIEEMFETQQFGRAPGRPADESFEVTDKGTAALDGKAIRRQVTIHLLKDPAAPKIHLLVYLPAAAKKPVPMLLSIGFWANQFAVDDPGITAETVWDPKTNTRVEAKPIRFFGPTNIVPLLDAGIGYATFYYGDVDPDYAEGFSNGIRKWYLKPGKTERAADEWGSIAAWAWGMSRVEDYFETDTAIDAKRVAIHGVSRLGKTVDVGGRARPAICGGDCELLGRGRRGAEPSRLRRDHRASDGAFALSLSVCG